MELIRLSIFSQYKNLRGLQIYFDGQENTHLLIGNNGSGKSSILEAISSIFNTLYDNSKNTFEFDFNIVYKIDGKKISLTQKNNKLKIKIDGTDSTLANLRQSFLPSRVICNYSGEELRIKEKYYAPAFDNFIDRLKNTGGNNTLKMVFIDRDVWQIILLIMLACQENWDRFKSFINDTLQLPALESIRLDIDERQLRSWTENTVTYYIQRILDKIDADGNIDIADVNPDGEDPMVLFNLWNSARPLINNLSINFHGGIDAMMLSEGEKKLMVILFILEAIADEKALVLLDEPDSHIHVARKSELKGFFDNAANRRNILTSHSPTLTSTFPSKSIIMLDRMPNGLASVVEKNKKEIVELLTNGIWTIQEQNIFLASNKTILIGEGKTDEQILASALKIHQRNGNYQNLDFSYFPAGGASNVPTISEKFTPKPGQMIIAFFDGDDAGLNAIRKIFDDSTIEIESFGNAHKKGTIWYSFYPCPPKKKNMKKFNIEDYFPRPVFLKYVMAFKGLKDICTEANLKSKIADDCTKNLIANKYFDNFKYLFDRIQKIMDAETQGLDHI